MITEEMMRLFREQMETWMKLVSPTEAFKSSAEMQKAWESFFRQQLELFQTSSEHTRQQVEQMMRPFLQQMETMQTAAKEMQQTIRWFTDEAGTMFKAMRDYYRMLADIEEQLAKLHRLTAEQVERVQRMTAPSSPEKEARGKESHRS
jgi:uncharacterized protein YeaO (DUF488 family)